jgi:hypothetical protein
MHLKVPARVPCTRFSPVVPLLSLLLRPQLPCHAGRLTVLLDLDGTLVSSFTPRRAPALPPSMKTHLVGVGSSLNPAGVFVVERPGLGQFLQQLAAISEVVVFTAGELDGPAYCAVCHCHASLYETHACAYWSQRSGCCKPGGPVMCLVGLC